MKRRNFFVAMHACSHFGRYCIDVVIVSHSCMGKAMDFNKLYVTKVTALPFVWELRFSPIPPSVAAGRYLTFPCQPDFVHPHRRRLLHTLLAPDER